MIPFDTSLHTYFSRIVFLWVPYLNVSIDATHSERVRSRVRAYAYDLLWDPLEKPTPVHESHGLGYAEGERAFGCCWLLAHNTHATRNAQARNA